MNRIDGRKASEGRPIKITRNFTKFAEGSVLIEVGQTKVICTASVENKVPSFLKGTGQGWLTAEYSMLPRATQTRTDRESAKGKLTGRTHEIQRLIGRSLRAVLDLKELGERTIWIDADVIQADGGTRTAAITGSFVAVYDALGLLKERGELSSLPINEFVAAVSVGLVEGVEYLDLCYEEDSKAEVDMNVVMTESGKLIEVQATAEGSPFTRPNLDRFLTLAESGIKELITCQKQALLSSAKWK